MHFVVIQQTDEINFIVIKGFYGLNLFVNIRFCLKL